jgi:hypothetical protein
MAHEQEHKAPLGANNQSERDMRKDEAGREAGREYDRDVEKMSQGEVDRAAKEAERALDSPEGKELRKAEEIGKRRGQGDEPGGKR